MPKNDSDSEQGHAVALFRYGLIADLVQLQPGSKGLYALIEHKAAAQYAIPGSTRTRVAEETIHDWLKAYRRGGFDALLPKPRADRGQSRSLPSEVVDVLLEVKEGTPMLAGYAALSGPTALPADGIDVVATLEQLTKQGHLLLRR